MPTSIAVSVVFIFDYTLEKDDRHPYFRLAAYCAGADFYNSGCCRAMDVSRAGGLRLA